MVNRLFKQLVIVAILLVWTVALQVQHSLAAPLTVFPSLAATFSCSGATEKGRTVSTKIAQSWVDELERSYKGVTALKGSFMQESFLASLELSELSNGEITFSKPGMMRWVYQSPEPQVFVVKDDVMWFYQPDQRQLIIDNFEKQLLSDVPVGFLMGIGTLSDRFTVELGCTTKQGRVVRLRPKQRQESTTEAHSESSAGSALSYLDILLHGVSGVKLPLMGVSVHDSAGNVTSVLLSDLKLNTPVAEDTFALDVPRGTDIDDRRIMAATLVEKSLVN